jgi:hypothetical protein
MLKEKCRKKRKVYLLLRIMSVLGLILSDTRFCLFYKKLNYRKFRNDIVKIAISSDRRHFLVYISKVLFSIYKIQFQNKVFGIVFHVSIGPFSTNFRFIKRKRNKIVCFLKIKYCNFYKLKKLY